MKNLGIVLLVAFAVTYGCASYHFGRGGRVLPGGYDRVSIPMFINKTAEVGIETYFTQELRSQFQRSRLAKVTSEADAQLILRGTIKTLTMAPTVDVLSSSNQLQAPVPSNLGAPPSPAPGSSPANYFNPLPQNAVLAKQYSVTLMVHIEAHKASDDSVMWQSDFTSAGVYQAPLLGTPTGFGGGKQTSDPLYNQNSRQDSIARVAKDMMAEAHDRLTENF